MDAPELPTPVQLARLLPPERKVRHFSKLHSACSNGHLEVAQYLARYVVCDVDGVAEHGSTPLIIACRNGHTHVAKFLIDQARARTGVANDRGFTALHEAVWGNHIETGGYLLKARELPGLALETPDAKDGRTPLHFACQQGSLDMVRLLIGAGASPTATTTEHGYTPFHNAVMCGHVPVVAYMLETRLGDPGEPNKPNGGTPLQLAAFFGHVDILKLLCEAGADLWATDSLGRTALARASEQGRADAVRFLLTIMSEHDRERLPGILNVFDTTSTKSTVLHGACQGGSLEVVKMLVAAGARLDLADATGCLPVHVAACNGRVDVVQHLLVGSTPTTVRTTKHDRTVLHIAAMHNHHAVASMLLERDDAHELVRATDAYGETALYVACWRGSPDVAGQLVGTGARLDLEARSRSGKTPYLLAALYGHVHILRLLREAGAKTDAVDKQGWTALHLASWKGHAEAVKYLLGEPGAESDTRLVEAKTRIGETAELIACRSGHADIVRMLRARH